MTFISNKILIALIILTLITLGAGTWFFKSQTTTQLQPIDINAITPEESCTLEFEVFPVDTPTHLECRNEACINVSGAGTNECNVDADCIEETHLECVNEACKEVDGSGSDECDSDSDCEEETHLECVNEACKEVEGDGENECESDNDCEETIQPTPTPTPQVPVTGYTPQIGFLLLLLITAGTFIRLVIKKGS